MVNKAVRLEDGEEYEDYGWGWQVDDEVE